jgi:hypothetical protein
MPQTENTNTTVSYIHFMPLHSTHDHSATLTAASTSKSARRRLHRDCPPGDKLAPVISIMANKCFLFSSSTSKCNFKAAVIGKSAAAHRCSDSIFCRRLCRSDSTRGRPVGFPAVGGFLNPGGTFSAHSVNGLGSTSTEPPAQLPVTLLALSTSN